MRGNCVKAALRVRRLHFTCGINSRIVTLWSLVDFHGSALVDSTFPATDPTRRFVEFDRLHELRDRTE